MGKEADKPSFSVFPAYLRIKASPGAPLSRWIGQMADGTWKVAVAAPPEKGRANNELLSFLGAELGVDKRRIRIISGAGERLKLIRIVPDEDY